MSITLVKVFGEVFMEQKFSQKIKDVIHEMVYAEEAPNVKVSAYLVDKLNHSYSYLANLFSDITFTSIENYVIIQKIEFAKQFPTRVT